MASDGPSLSGTVAGAPSTTRPGVDEVVTLPLERTTIPESVRVLRTLVGNLPGMAYRCADDAAWTMHFVSDGCLALTGYGPDELVGNSRLAFNDLIHEDDAEMVRREVKAAVARRERWTIEYRIHALDGSQKWVWERGIGVFGADGALQALEGFITDVSQRREVLEALSLSEADLRHANGELGLRTEIAHILLTRNDAAMFAEVLDVIRRVTGSQWGLIGYIDEGGALVVPSLPADIHEACRAPQDELRLPPEKWGDGTWARTLRNGQSEICNAPGHVPAGHLPIDCTLCVPLKRGETTIGIIAVANRPGGYRHPELATVETIAECTAMVMHEWIARTVEERARKRAEDALRESEHMYRTLFEESPVGVVAYDTALRVVDCNACFCEMLGRRQVELVGLTASSLADPAVAAALHVALQGHAGSHEGWCRGIASDRDLWVLVKTAPRRNADGEVFGATATFVDRTEQKLAELRALHLQLHDPITDLPNRTLLADRLEEASARARRRGLSFAVAVLEIGRFDTLTESLGATTVDEIVADVARRITATVSEEDTVARIGTRQFALILPDVRGPAEMATVAGNLHRSLSEPLVAGARSLFVASSIGVAVYPADGPDLLQAAQVATRRAAAAGGHQWQFYHSNMNVERDERLALEADLHRALARDQFILHYQPQVDTHTGDIVGAEALLRWCHPDRGLVAPMEFIPLAEETGLMVPIGAWTLREACAQAATWRGRNGRDTSVSVNLSLRQMQSADVVDTVAAALHDSGLRPSLLELEITETLAMSDPEVTARVLTAFRDLGVRVALDDFGTGFSSLSHVLQLPVDTVKIDRAFVRDVSLVPQHAAVANAVITLGHSLGLTVVAEGVETAEERAFMQRRGCHVIQGFYFSKPVPAEEFERLVELGTLLP